MDSEDLKQEVPEMLANAKLHAAIGTDPVSLAAMTLTGSKLQDHDDVIKFSALSETLKQKKGLSQEDIEERLALNVITLDHKFHELLRMATPDGNFSTLTTKDRCQLYKLALGYQEQVRKTADTLNKIRNPKPRAVFIKNQIAQQVNQLKMETEQIKQQLQLGENENAPVDFRSQKEAKRSHTKLEALD